MSATRRLVSMVAIAQNPTVTPPLLLTDIVALVRGDGEEATASTILTSAHHIRVLATECVTLITQRWWRIHTPAPAVQVGEAKTVPLT